MLARELELEVAEAQVLEDLLDDVRGGLALEDAAVGGPREEPQPGDDLGPVVAAVLRSSSPAKKRLTRPLK